jgi:hypothetical protein
MERFGFSPKGETGEGFGNMLEKLIYEDRYISFFNFCDIWFSVSNQAG